jgi:hypothetical protein
MNISFSSEGGFAGLKRKFSSTKNEVDAQLHPVLDGLLASKSIKPESNANLRDGIQYHLDLEKEGIKKSFQFSDGNIPTEVQPLINFLEAKSTAV